MNRTDPYTSAHIDSINNNFENIKSQDSAAIFIHEVSQQNLDHKRSNERIGFIFSRGLDQIRQIFQSIGTQIFSSIKSFQMARQEERIRQLEQKSDFQFRLSGDKNYLPDIKEALLKASLSNEWTEVHIDQSGKLCEPQNSVLIFTYLPNEKRFIAYPGPKKAPEEFQVNNKPIALTEPEKSYQRDEHFHLKGRKNSEISNKGDDIELSDFTLHTIFEVHITPGQIERRAEEAIVNERIQYECNLLQEAFECNKACLEADQTFQATIQANAQALQTALLEERERKSQLPQTFFINSNGGCDKENATAFILYDRHTQNFTVNPIDVEITDLKLNGESIEGGQNIPFQDGDNIFTSDTNSLSFRVHIPLIAKKSELIEDEVKVKNDLFFSILTEMNKKITPPHIHQAAPKFIYIDKNGDISHQIQDNDSIRIEQKDDGDNFSVSSKNNNWKINGRPIGESGIEFNMYQSNSFTRGESQIVLSLEPTHPAKSLEETTILLPYE